MRHPIVRRPAYNFEALIRCIEEAQNSGLKRIMMRFAGFIIKPSKYAGRLYIFSYEKELNQWGTMSNKYLGWITSDSTNLAEVSLIKHIQEVAANPTHYAKVFGQETGQCSCCGKQLTVKESIALGIGPICKVKFGL